MSSRELSSELASDLAGGGPSRGTPRQHAGPGAHRRASRARGRPPAPCSARWGAPARPRSARQFAPSGAASARRGQTLWCCARERRVREPGARARARLAARTRARCAHVLRRGAAWRQATPRRAARGRQARGGARAHAGQSKRTRSLHGLAARARRRHAGSVPTRCARACGARARRRGRAARGVGTVLTQHPAGGTARLGQLVARVAARARVRAETRLHILHWNQPYNEQ